MVCARPPSLPSKKETGWEKVSGRREKVSRICSFVFWKTQQPNTFESDERHNRVRPTKRTPHTRAKISRDITRSRDPIHDNETAGAHHTHTPRREKHRTSICQKIKLSQSSFLPFGHSKGHLVTGCPPLTAGCLLSALPPRRHVACGPCAPIHHTHHRLRARRCRCVHSPQNLSPSTPF
jgi:hypothetical protein